MNLKKEQTGRSMIEMLGVLAIIGVLSIGGILGYSKAMAKYKITKATDQISLIVANVTTLYVNKNDFSDLTTASAVKLNVAPKEMVDGTTLKNSFAGTALIGPAANDKTAFGLTYNNVPNDACSVLTSLDWDGGTKSSFLGMVINSTELAAIPDLPARSAKNFSATVSNIGANALPLTPTETAATCSSGNTNSITLFFN